MRNIFEADLPKYPGRRSKSDVRTREWSGNGSLSQVAFLVQQNEQSDESLLCAVRTTTAGEGGKERKKESDNGGQLIVGENQKRAVSLLTDRICA